MRKRANTRVAKRLQFNQWPLEAGCLRDESLLNWPVCINVTSSAGKQLYFFPYLVFMSNFRDIQFT